MPYIKREQREELDPLIDALVAKINDMMPGTAVEARYLAQAGILNYCCTRLGLGVIPVRQYWAIALKSGVFHNIADEFYRRYAAPYEDRKIAENGDVYPEIDLRTMYGFKSEVKDA